MNVSELQGIFAYLDSFGVGAVVGGVLVYFFLKSFIPSYLSERGKNLATKEDIRKITEEIEKIKANMQRNCRIRSIKRILY